MRARFTRLFWVRTKPQLASCSQEPSSGSHAALLCCGTDGAAGAGVAGVGGRGGGGRPGGPSGPKFAFMDERHSGRQSISQSLQFCRESFSME